MNRRLLLTLFLGVLLAALDIAILGPVLPALRLEFGGTTRDSSWLITAYVLANLVGTPLLGRLSDRNGRRFVYALSLTGFAIGSLGVVFASNLNGLIAARAIQGFGSGGIFPVASAVIGDVVAPDKRGRVLGLLGATFGLAFLVGPPIGGTILAFAGWRWIFALNIPLVLLVMALAWRVLPSRGRTNHNPFDFKGLATFGGGLVLVAAGLSALAPAQPFLGLNAPHLWVPLLAGALLLSMTPRIEKAAKDPLVPPFMLAPGLIRNVLLLGLGAGLGEVAVMLLPDLAVQALGVTPAKGSFLLVPLVLGLTLAAPVSGRLLDRVGARPILLVGVLLQSFSMGAFLLLPTTRSLYFVAGPLLGAGLACLLAGPLRWLLLRHVDSDQRTGAQSLLSLSHSVGQITTAAFLGALATSFGTHGIAAGLRLSLGVGGFVSLLLLIPALGIPKRGNDDSSLDRVATAEH
jgi:multidrug resistance protein